MTPPYTHPYNVDAYDCSLCSWTNLRIHEVVKYEMTNSYMDPKVLTPIICSACFDIWENKNLIMTAFKQAKVTPKLDITGCTIQFKGRFWNRATHIAAIREGWKLAQTSLQLMGTPNTSVHPYAHIRPAPGMKVWK